MVKFNSSRGRLFLWRRHLCSVGFLYCVRTPLPGSRLQDRGAEALVRVAAATCSCLHVRLRPTQSRPRRPAACSKSTQPRVSRSLIAHCPIAAPTGCRRELRAQPLPQPLPLT